MITAFIPTYNSERTLRDTIHSIKSQSVTVKRIIVIDSGSTDNTKKIAEDENVEFYSPDYFGFKFLGLGRARNRILDLVDSSYLLSVDSDVVLEKDYIKKLFPLIENNSEIAGVAGKQIEQNRMFIPDKVRAVIEMRNLYIPLSMQKSEFKDFLLGSNNIYRVKNLKEISEHPFNDELATNYEDVDIGEKLRKSGYKLLWTPEVLTFHLQRDDLYSFVERAYRYRVFKWKLKGAFDDLEIYKGKIEHNINYTKMGFKIAVEKERLYLLYPYFLIGFYFFLKDAEIFYKNGKKDFSNFIKNAIFKNLENINEDLKYFIINDLNKLGIFIDNSKNNIINDSLIIEWIESLANFNLFDLDKKYIKKVLILSRKRIDFEKKLITQGKNKILILNLKKVDSKIIDSVEETFCKDKKILDLFFNYQNDKVASWIIDASNENYNEDEIFYEILNFSPEKVYVNEKLSENLEERLKCMMKRIYYI